MPEVDHVSSHIQVTHQIELRFARAYGTPFEDVFSAGLEGLRRAALSFDPERDRKFWGYAKHRVQGMCMDLIRRRAKRRAIVQILALGNDRWRHDTAFYIDEEGREHSQILVDSRDPVDPLLWPRVWRVLDRMDQARRYVMTDPKWNRSVSPSRRRIFELFYLEGLTLAEIGVLLDVSESRIGQIHLDGLAELRREFRA